MDVMNVQNPKIISDLGLPLGVVDIWWVEFPKGTPLELIDRRPTIRQDVTN